MADNLPTPEWRKALRDVASVLIGAFLLVNESALQSEPRQIVMYVGAFLLAGPAILRVLGK